ITPNYPCSPTASTNIYIMGMRPHTPYRIQAVYTGGPTTTRGPAALFTTGSIASTIQLPGVSVPISATASASTSQAVVFHDGNGDPWLATPPKSLRVYATDLQGNL